MREIRNAAVKLRSLRAHTKMSILELSDKSGVSERTINRVESADMVGYNPQTKTLGSLAHVYGMTLGTLLSAKSSEVCSLIK